MTSSPLVSVIMPVYNAGRYLEPAVQSVLDQTFGDLELLIVDDRSTDGAVDGLDLSDPRVRVLTNSENLGAAGTRNRALREANGTLIALQDADDVSDRDRLERTISLLRSDETLCCVGGGHRYVDADDQPIATTDFDASTVSGYALVPTSHTAISLSLRTHLPFGHGSMVARASCMREAGGYDAVYEPAEDYALFARMLMRGCKFAGTARPVFTYRVHSSGISRTGAARLLWSNQTIGAQVRESIEFPETSACRKAIRSEPMLERAEPRLLSTKQTIRQLASERPSRWMLGVAAIALASGPKCATMVGIDGAKSLTRRARARLSGREAVGPALS